MKSGCGRRAEGHAAAKRADNVRRARYELVPAPSLTISMTVAPGDHMHASVAETVPNSNVWNITIKDVTRGESFSTTVPYSSTHATAEWIEETPLLIGTNAGFASLPNLSNPAFDLGTTNGATVKLTSSEQMDLTDSSGKVIGTRLRRRRIQRLHVGHLVHRSG
jgi:hypothetical protein